MKNIFFTIVIFIFTTSGIAQVSNTGVMDTTSGTKLEKLSIGGYIDTYDGGFFSETIQYNIRYFVSMNRTNEPNINLAYIDCSENQISKISDQISLVKEKL